MVEVLLSLMFLFTLIAIPVFGIITLIFLFRKKPQTKRFFKLTGLSFGLFVVSLILIGAFFTTKSINMESAEKIELRANEAHEVTIELKDWKDPDTLYIGEVWQEIDDATLKSDVKTLHVTDKDIANEAIILEKSLTANEVRKLITVTLDKAAAEEFVQETIKTHKITPPEADTYEAYIEPPEDTTAYVTYLNSDVRAAYVVALADETEAIEAADKEQAAEEAKAAKAAEKKAVAAKEKEAAKVNKKLSGMKVHFIDVGQADAALIQFDDKAILIDSGDWNRNETVTYLQNQGIKKIDIMVGSHPHADHIGQMDKVIDNFEVDEVWMSGGLATTQVFERVITAIDDNDIGYDEPRAGDSYQIGDLKIDILSPSSMTGNLNDDSIVMKLTYGGVSFLFTGDAETRAEGNMVSSGQNLSATILKVGHHGSDTSTTQSFLDKVDPEVVVISVAEKSKYDHPNKSVVDRINAKKIALYATKSHGNIVINTDGVTYDISTGNSSTVTAGDTGNSPAKKAPSSTSSSKPSKTETIAPATGNCIDINKASEAELQNIKHIGAATAPKVVDARPFDNVDQLTSVSGIADKKLSDIKAEGKACVK